MERQKVPAKTQAALLLSALLWGMTPVSCKTSTPPGNNHANVEDGVKVQTAIGSIPDGLIHSRSSDKRVWQAEIEQQLAYMIGQLHRTSIAGELSQLDVTINDAGIKSSDNLQVVAYSARMVMSWPQAVSVPEHFELILPRRADQEGLQSFFESYKICADTEKRPRDISSDMFWYYYRPTNPACPLRAPSKDEPHVARFPVFFVFKAPSVAEKLKTRSREAEIVPTHSNLWDTHGSFGTLESLKARDADDLDQSGFPVKR